MLPLGTGQHCNHSMDIESSCVHPNPPFLYHHSVRPASPAPLCACCRALLPLPHAELGSIEPFAAPPGAPLSLVGPVASSLASDCRPQPWGGTEGCLGPIRVGPWLCVPPEGDTQAAIRFDYKLLWRQDVFVVNCSVPEPTRSNPRVRGCLGNTPGAPRACVSGVGVRLQGWKGGALCALCVG